MTHDLQNTRIPSTAMYPIRRYRLEPYIPLMAWLILLLTSALLCSLGPRSNPMGMATAKAGIIYTANAIIHAMNPFRVSFHKEGLRLAWSTELKKSSTVIRCVALEPAAKVAPP